MRNTSCEKDTWSSLAALPERLGLASLRIAVAAGGVGPERPVSLQTGRAVHAALRRRVPRCRLVDLHQAPGRRLGALLRGVDLVFVALHGPYGEDGGFQQALEEIGLPYTGSGPSASRLAFDKCLARQRFAASGLRIPEGMELPLGNGEPLENTVPLILDKPGLPAVVKPACSGSSVGVSVVREKEALLPALRRALAAGPSGRKAVVVERLVEGRDVTVGILAGRALPPVASLPAGGFYDYRAKYLSASTRYEAPARLGPRTTRRLQEAALGAFSALGCRDYARVDFMVTDDGRTYLLEVNTIPGMTSHSLLPMAARTVGIDFPTLVAVMAALALERT